MDAISPPLETPARSSPRSGQLTTASRARPPLTVGAALVGMIFGALVGGLLISGSLLLVMIGSQWEILSWAVVASSFGMALTIIPFAAIAWGMGLAVVGAPAWFVLHALGVRSRGAAAAWGATLTGLGVTGLLVLSDNAIPGGWVALVFALVLAPFGAVVGWTTAKVAQDSCGEMQ